MLKLSEEVLSEIFFSHLQWFTLEAVKHGDIHLEMFFLELSTDISLMGHDEAWEKAANKELSDAVLLVYVDNVSNLPVRTWC